MEPTKYVCSAIKKHYFEVMFQCKQLTQWQRDCLAKRHNWPHQNNPNTPQILLESFRCDMAVISSLLLLLNVYLLTGNQKVNYMVKCWACANSANWKICLFWVKWDFSYLFLTMFSWWFRKLTFFYTIFFRLAQTQITIFFYLCTTWSTTGAVLVRW